MALYQVMNNKEDAILVKGRAGWVPLYPGHTHTSNFVGNFEALKQQGVAVWMDGVEQTIVSPCDAHQELTTEIKISENELSTSCPSLVKEINTMVDTREEEKLPHAHLEAKKKEAKVVKRKAKKAK